MSGSNVVYFVTTAQSGFYPTALWASDGTQNGTRLIASYAAGLSILPLESLAGAFVYAVGNPGTTDLVLTLGTALSTHQVIDAPFGVARKASFGFTSHRFAATKPSAPAKR